MSNHFKIKSVCYLKKSQPPKDPTPVFDATAYSLSAIVSKVHDKLVHLLMAERIVREPEQRVPPFNAYGSDKSAVSGGKIGSEWPFPGNFRRQNGLPKPTAGAQSN